MSTASEPVPSPHRPVMLDEVIEVLRPRAGSKFLDGTFGAGGYTRALLDAGAEVTALDRDPTVIAAAEQSGLVDRPGLRLELARFSQLDEYATDLDGVVLDIGVSSMQLDRAERGFSFRFAGPLDMRMSGKGPSAADVVAALAPADLTRVIGLLGEERHAARISRAIVAERSHSPILTTDHLARVIEGAVPRRSGDRIHPATRTFQAIRIYVNEELDELSRALGAAERALGEGGVLAVVTFHSLEDRIVKRFIAERASSGGGSRHRPAVEERAPTFELLGKQGRGPDDEELARNPRSRSARLRAARRTSAAPRDEAVQAPFNLPPLSSLGVSS